MKKLLYILFTILVLLPPAQADEIIYFIPDASGSPIAAMDEQANIIWRKHYTPFGAEIETTSDSRISYTGHVKDDVTGLIYMGGRYYDPTVPRFMSMDPAAINPNDPRTFNRYNYANNNPLRYVDPDGRESQEALYKMLGIPDPNAALVARAKAVAESANAAANVTDAVVTDPTNLVPGAAGAKLLGAGVLAIKGAKEVATTGKAFSKEKQALVEMAKSDKKIGMTAADMQAYKDLNKQLPDPFPTSKVRGPEAHQSGVPSSQTPHGHVGPVNHIPIVEPKL